MVRFLNHFSSPSVHRRLGLVPLPEGGEGPEARAGLDE